MARHRRRRSRKEKSGFGLSRKTLFSLIAIGFLLATVMTVLSFLQRGSVLIRINNLVTVWLGQAAVFLPFLLLTIALIFSDIKTPFRQPYVPLGTILMLLSFAGLSKGGRLGQLIWQELSLMILPVGAYIFLAFSFLMGLVVLFNTSLDQLLAFLWKIFTTVKGKIISPAEKKPIKPLFVVPTPEGPKAEKVAPKKSFLASLIGGQPKRAVSPPTPVQPTEMPIQDEETDFSSSMTKAATVSPTPKNRVWRYPPLEILEDSISGEADRGNINENASTIEKTLDSFGIMARVVEVNKGPAVTQYGIQVALGTKLSKITALSNDLALALAAPTGQIRIEAPIPGRSLVGLEVPNKTSQTVTLKEMLVSEAMKQSKSKLTVPLGLDVSGKPRVADIGRMPHVLMAGQTGSGKSVMMNSWIATLLSRTTPEEVKLILVDPKRVEMTQYNGVPHLLTPVIHDPDKVVSALKWTVDEMRRRYKLFAEVKARNVEGYNEIAGFQSLPYIVIFIDELADIILYAPAEVEDSICRIAQMARATGIHLVVATQRPSVDVLTGLIKANIPARISFAVASMTDSRVIIDTPGAEKLLGRGDMLYIPPDQAKPSRIQGPYITDHEVGRLIEFLHGAGEAVYDERVITQPVTTGKGKSMGANGEEKDSLFNEAAKLVIEQGKASSSLIQRRFKVGYARAARILDELEAAGIVGPADGSKPREVLTAAIPEPLAEPGGRS